MRRLMASLLLGLTLVGGAAGSAFATEPVKTQIWLDGALVRTILPPASMPKEGTDPFYMVPRADGGVDGVAAVGPGDAGYRGGRWAVYTVSWNVAPYELRSYDAIMAARTADDIEITRRADLDFLCPIQGR